MGRRKKQRIPQEIIPVSLDTDTMVMVKGWKQKGMNVSEMVRYCMTQTFPVIITPAHEIDNLRQLAGFHTQKFEQVQERFEKKMNRIKLKIGEAKFQIDKLRIEAKKMDAENEAN